VINDDVCAYELTTTEVCQLNNPPFKIFFMETVKLIQRKFGCLDFIPPALAGFCFDEIG
jgi:hypothetical protein